MKIPPIPNDDRFDTNETLHQTSFTIVGFYTYRRVNINVIILNDDMNPDDKKLISAYAAAWWTAESNKIKTEQREFMKMIFISQDWLIWGGWME